MNVLFAASEAYPLVKTGGLADVAGHLPIALNQQGAEVTLVLPGYGQVLENYPAPVMAHVETWSGYALLRETFLPDSALRVWLVDHPIFKHRIGNPYVDAKGHEWHDNAQAFALFSHVVAKVLAGHSAARSDYDLVHCHDWQTGLLPAYLQQESVDLPVVFTIHNLAYQGVYSPHVRHEIHLHDRFWHMGGVEFHGLLSFMKSGLVFADKITTVSPSYAEEIKTETFGYGLAGLLRARAKDLSGIINGIDTEIWNPAKDPLIAANYSLDTLDDKRLNKLALQRELGLPEDEEVLLLGHVGRMVEQKGVDVILDALEGLFELPVQLAIVGTGAAHLEQGVRAARAEWPERLGAHLGYDERLAHLLEAGADVFLMPSRFEPCGLNQMYSQVYGTLPLVNPTGGLRDTVVDASLQAIADGTGSGFHLEGLSPAHLVKKVGDALGLYRDTGNWRRTQGNAMRKDFSWANSARQYLSLYQTLSKSAE